MLADGGPFADDDEGEAFEFEDSGDEVTGADLPPPAPEASGAPAPAPSDIAAAAGRVQGPAEPPPASATEEAPPVTARTASIAKEALGEDGDLPLPPPPPPPGDVGRTGWCGGGTSSVPASGGDRVARLLFLVICCGFRSLSR